METYFEKPYGIVSWNEQLNVVELTWTGYVGSEDMRLTLDKALELVKERKSARFMSDARKLKVILPEDQTWINENWTPRLAASSVKKMASLIPESAIAKMSLDKLSRQAEKASTAPVPFEFSYFATPEQARTWLKN